MNNQYNYKKYNINNDTQSIFLLLSDAHTFEVDKIKDILPNFKTKDLKEIYVTITSKNKLSFFYHHKWSDMYIDNLAQEIANYWNSIQIAYASNGVLVENNQSCIDFVIDILKSHYNNGQLITHLNKEKEFYALLDYQKKYEHN